MKFYNKNIYHLVYNTWEIMRNTLFTLKNNPMDTANIELGEHHSSKKNK